MNDKSNKPAVRKRGVSMKAETIAFLKKELTIKNLEIKVEQSKADFMKKQPEFSEQLPTIQKQLAFLNAQKNSLEGCLKWVESAE